MSEAWFALLGTFLGAGATILSSWIKARHELQTRQLELSEQTREHDLQIDLNERTEKRKRYVNVLSALRNEEGELFEIMDFLKERGPSWKEQIRLSLDDEAHLQRIRDLNIGISWVSLLCESEELENQAIHLGELYNDLIERMEHVSSLSEDDESLDRMQEELQTHFSTFQGAITDLARQMREDASRRLTKSLE